MPEHVLQLVREVLRSGIIDEPDLCREVLPFMAAVKASGLSSETASAAIIETYRIARRAVDRLAAERAKGLRAPAASWSGTDAEMLDDSEMLRAMFPGAQGG